MNTTFLVVGGGIAGITCVEHLCYLVPHETVVLVTASPLVKNVTNLVPLGKTFYKFDVNEIDAELIQKKHPSLSIVYDKLKRVHSREKKITTDNGLVIEYKYICLCMGAVPNIISQGLSIDRVLGIRDSGSVKTYLEYLKSAKRLVVVGNGGIASELIYATKGVETIWVVKDKYISSTFIDPGAAEFFRTSDKFTTKPTSEKSVVKRMIYSEEEQNTSDSLSRAAALGPDWLKGFDISGINRDSSLKIIYESEVINVVENDKSGWPLMVILSNGQSFDCDALISATGVEPCSSFECDQAVELGPDGGLAIDWKMNTSVDSIYAAGDICYAKWLHAPQWFQMRLWSQAMQMGAMAAKSMHAHLTSETILQDFCFELFSHTTNLFGYQVILLGKFNGQGLGKDYEILLRTTPNLEYIKFVMADNRLQGAILIGETGLEETCENLILNQLDLSPYGDDILNPDIDIEDYFD